MNRHTLCDKDIAVHLHREVSYTVLEVSDGAKVRFVCPPRSLRAVLGGCPLQLSNSGGYCLLEAQEAVIRLQFSLRNRTRQACEFPLDLFAEALDSLKVV